MGNINTGLLNFFNRHYKPGAIGLVGTADMIGMAIREAQRGVTVDNSSSLWSHCFILGDMRLDRRGDNEGLTRSIYLFESDLKVNFKAEVRNGAQENWIGKWCTNEVQNATAIDLGLNDDERERVLGTALQLVDEQVLYSIQELIGTWWAIVTKRQWQNNPLDNRNAIYCSSFARYCNKEAGRDFLGRSVSISNTTPEAISRAVKNRMVRYRS